MNLLNAAKSARPHPSSEKRAEIFQQIGRLFPGPIRLVRNPFCLPPVANYFEPYFPRELADGTDSMHESKHVYIPRFDVIYRANDDFAARAAHQMVFSNRSRTVVRFYSRLLLCGWSSLCPYFVEGLPEKGCEVMLFRCLKGKVKQFDLSSETVKSYWLNVEEESLFRSEAQLRESPLDGEVCSPTIEIDHEGLTITESFVSGRHLEVGRLSERDEAELIVEAFRKLATISSHFGMRSVPAGEYISSIIEGTSLELEGSEAQLLKFIGDFLLQQAEQAGIDSIPVGTIHGDFNLRNVLVTDTNEICLLDFEAMREAHVFFDLWTCLWKIFTDYATPRQWRRISKSASFRVAISEIVTALGDPFELHLDRHRLKFFAGLGLVETLSWILCDFRPGLERLPVHDQLFTLEQLAEGRPLPWIEPILNGFDG